MTVITLAKGGLRLWVKTERNCTDLGSENGEEPGLFWVTWWHGHRVEGSCCSLALSLLRTQLTNFVNLEEALPFHGSCGFHALLDWSRGLNQRVSLCLARWYDLLLRETTNITICRAVWTSLEFTFLETHQSRLFTSPLILWKLLPPWNGQSTCFCGI